ncbi:calmodulin calcium-dependent NAD kinase-like isoform X2 [Vicia villosa]|nr:calmodulin calcium-dependent NAD kinase-like isoform X2 [Vicia villosa]
MIVSESSNNMQLQLQDGSVGNVMSNLAHVMAASIVGLIGENSVMVDQQKIIPYLHQTESGHVAKLESFSHYVARQMGFVDAGEVPELCRLAQDYLRNSEGCKESIYQYVANGEDPNALYAKLIDEFERCILSYFAFHWNRASFIISQVLSTQSQTKINLKKILLAATREHRFERVTKKLKVARVFSTLVEEIKAIKGDSQSCDVKVPILQSERSPVLLLMGGGMGSGKSTVLKDILRESFWSEAASNVVVVQADAFKESDVIYRALNSNGHHDEMLQSAELVHKSSTDAASSLLVTALNKGRDVIMDGTLAWEPFLEQTIAMARNVHKYTYRMGPGYREAKDGTITENYWEQVNEAVEEHQPEENYRTEQHTRKPYKIVLVGMVCDAYLAVVRGIRRAIVTKRAVRVKSQLESHKKFANAFPRYCKLVDSARLYCTNVVAGPPKIIEWKNDSNNLQVDPEVLKLLNTISNVNTEAGS